MDAEVEIEGLREKIRNMKQALPFVDDEQRANLNTLIEDLEKLIRVTEEANNSQEGEEALSQAVNDEEYAAFEVLNVKAVLV